MDEVLETTPEYKATRKAYEALSRRKEYRDRPDVKARAQELRDMPENKALKLLQQRIRRRVPKIAKKSKDVSQRRMDW
tara:strand:- start:164 stop:397 length:234 start_codon:yes stop_codon:yes gene_type:complete